METVIINKTKEWLEKAGVDLNLFNNKRLSCERSKTMILIKNLSFNTKEEELKEMLKKIEYIEKRGDKKVEFIDLDETNEKELLEVLNNIENLINQPIPPKPKIISLLAPPSITLAILLPFLRKDCLLHSNGFHLRSKSLFSMFKCLFFCSNGTMLQAIVRFLCLFSHRN